jgi:hypothetical protein
MEQNRGNLGLFGALVMPGGKWDYKTQDRYFFYNGSLVSSATFGNINYGYAGTAGGFSPSILKDAGGFVQVVASKSYGNNAKNNYDLPEDTQSIQGGINGYVYSHPFSKSTLISQISDPLYKGSLLPDMARNFTSSIRLTREAYNAIKSEISSLYNWLKK